MTASYSPLVNFEDKLQDLRSLVQLLLYAQENSEREEFAKIGDTINTTLYLMLEKIEDLDRTHGSLWHIELAARRAERSEQTH